MQKPNRNFISAATYVLVNFQSLWFPRVAMIMCRHRIRYLYWIYLVSVMAFPLNFYIHWIARYIFRDKKISVMWEID